MFVIVIVINIVLSTCLCFIALCYFAVVVVVVSRRRRQSNSQWSVCCRRRRRSSSSSSSVRFACLLYVVVVVIKAVVVEMHEWPDGQIAMIKCSICSYVKIVTIQKISQLAFPAQE